MKLMMLAELGSTGAAEMSVFQRLVLGNGTKPLRLDNWPVLIPAQVPAWAKPEQAASASSVPARSAFRIRRMSPPSKGCWRREAPGEDSINAYYRLVKSLVY